MNALNIIGKLEDSSTGSPTTALSKGVRRVQQEHLGLLDLGCFGGAQLVMALLVRINTVPHLVNVHSVVLGVPK